jgi:hypothetical protein
LLYNAGPEMLHLEGDLWVVAAAQGGYYRVDLEAESCTCPDFEHYGLPNDVCCKHLFAVAIAHAHRRAQRPCACISGWVYLGIVGDDGVERPEAVRCRRCNA